MNDSWSDLLHEAELTYNGGRQERRWIDTSLAEFYADRLFTDVLYRVKGGKEATVYCCRAGPETGYDLIAAKVFRPRMFRAMRNDALYKQGRNTHALDGETVDDRRNLLAVRKKTAYGRLLDTAAWVQHEFRVLEELHAAGARVPRPHARSTNAFLMEYVGDERWGAPILHAVKLERAEARNLLDRLVENVAILLSRYWIHADLSAYNVLYWDGQAYLIDFPQAVDALRHPRAHELFVRDVDRLCRYFRRQGVDEDAAGLAEYLWSRCIG